MDWGHTMQQLTSAAIFGGVGVLLFLAAIWIATKVTPFSVRKEIEEDHNTAFAVVLGAVIIGLAIVLASAIH